MQVITNHKHQYVATQLNVSTDGQYRYQKIKSKYIKSTKLYLQLYLP